MEISTTEAGCGHSNENIVAGEGVRLGGGVLLGETTLLALENGERRHGYGVSCLRKETEKRLLVLGKE